MRQQRLVGLAAIFVLVGLFLIPGNIAWGANSNKQSRTKCETLSEKDARAVLDSLRLNEAKILKIQMSPVQGLWELAVENRGDRFLVYVDCSRNFVMPGPIIERQTGIDKTRQRVEELNRERRVDLTGLRLDEALVMGDRNAPVKVIGFVDPDCPFCKKLHHEMKKVLEKRTDIAFFLKLTLIRQSPQVEQKSKAVVCNRSLGMLEEAFEGKALPSAECDSKELEENTKFMETNGLHGVPVTLFPDGSVQVGFVESSALEARINEAVGRMKGEIKKQPMDAGKK